MLLSTLLLIYAVWCLLRGIGFIVSPQSLWKTFNVHLDKSTSFPVQLLGGAFIATALVNGMANKFSGSAAINVILLFNFSIELIQALITFYALLTNAIAKKAWIPFGFHLLFSTGFVYFLFY